MRRPLQAALAVVALLLVTACSGGSTDESEEDWTFTDDMGTKISLEAVPERIVAYKGVAAALADMGLGDRVVGVFGEPANPDPDLGLQSPDLDVDALPDVTGGEYGAVELEELAALEPDLIVTTTYGAGDYWYLSPDVAKRLGGTYDLAAINLEKETVDGVIENSERLALALGADEADFEAGHAALAKAGDVVRDAARAAGDPTIIATSTTPELLYVANPPAYADLTYLSDEIGLDVVRPAAKDLDEGDYWDSVSWEKADAYDADVALWDTRGGDKNLTTLDQQPVWNKVRAAQDGAYLPWRFEIAPSAQGYATMLELFAGDLEGLKD
jgi:iron complex transport system substrate-binding protein